MQGIAWYDFDDYLQMSVESLLRLNVEFLFSCILILLGLIASRLSRNVLI